MEAGAAGFLLKDSPAARLARAIRAAAAGERVVDPGLAAAALTQGENPLTAREQEVLAEARRHGTVAELASSLHLSHETTATTSPRSSGSWTCTAAWRRSEWRRSRAGCRP